MDEEKHSYDDEEEEDDFADFADLQLSSKMLDAFNPVFSVKPVENITQATLCSKGAPERVKEVFERAVGSEKEFEDIRKYHEEVFEMVDSDPDLFEFVEELRGNNILEEKINEARHNAKLKPLLKEHEAHQFAIYLYTTDDKDIQTTGGGKYKMYQGLNEALAKSEPKWRQFTTHLLGALKLLPYEWMTLYRGTSMYGDEHHYTKGNIVMWTAFTSTSKTKRVAQFFAHKSQKPVLFTIEAYSGRYIKHLSRFPSEDEVLLPPISLFEVLDKKRSKNGTLMVRLREYHMARGKKCLLWVDDTPINNKTLMENTESTRKDVNFIMLKNTKDAISFLEKPENKYLLRKGLDSFRIITDMYRDGDEAAGAKLIRSIRNKLKYTKPIMVYCGDVLKAQGLLQRHKPKTSGDVIVTRDEMKCMRFARFDSGF